MNYGRFIASCKEREREKKKPDAVATGREGEDGGGEWDSIHMHKEDRYRLTTGLSSIELRTITG